MRLITHRGFFHDNKAVGVLFSLIHPIVPDTLPWSETDLLWIGQEWVLCHDHGRFRDSRVVDPFSVLVEGLHHLRHRRWRLLLDIKWDEIHNRQDSLSEAVEVLERLLAPLHGLDIFLQVASEPVFRALPSAFPTGLLVSGGFLDVTALPDADFYNVDLHTIHAKDVRFLHDRTPEALLIGFTCHKVDDLPRYSHLYHLLDGIVCIRQ